MFFGRQLKEYRLVNKIFRRPKMGFYFGPWRKSPFLPLYRTNILYIGKYGTYDAKWSWARMESCEWNEVYKKEHPLFTRFFKPAYNLPLWLTFRLDSFSLGWKTKYDDYRFEYNPSWSITAFGWSFGVYFYPPRAKKSEELSEVDDDYWEAVLWTAYDVLWDRKTRKTNQDEMPKDFFDQLGRHTSWWISRGKPMRQLRSSFFKSKWLPMFEEYCNTHPYKEEEYFGPSRATAVEETNEEESAE